MSERDLENGFFEPDDFASKIGDNEWREVGDIRKWASEISNSILSQWLKEQVTVYALKPTENYEPNEWLKSNGVYHTHSATLVNIKKVGE